MQTQFGNATLNHLTAYKQFPFINMDQSKSRSTTFPLRVVSWPSCIKILIKQDWKIDQFGHIFCIIIQDIDVDILTVRELAVI